MKLVIVESPAKCETIKRYLGSDYIVKASLGHVRDLAICGKGGLGVDTENDFAPTYAIAKDKKAVVRDLKNIASKADEVILATDPDREGEAIAWHLANVLHLNIKKNKRLEFHEITRDSITNAMNNPRTINLDLVSSQETRRILDRVIGFELSSLLNKKIHSRSAGRVQSATLKLIYDHELEIQKFVPEEYWNINASILYNKKDVSINYLNYKGEHKDIKNKAIADEILNAIPEKLTVKSVVRSVKVTESNPPFTTSTMQQEAFSKLKYKTKKTQFIAQHLYEGIDVAGEHMGLITYMRTDSIRLSPSYVARANKYILQTFGSSYLGTVKHGKSSDNIQDAHEAIRPTSNHRTPDSVRQYLSSDEYNLYKLIYNRAVASLMAPKKEEIMTIILEGGGVEFKLELSRSLFKGFEILYKETHGDIRTFPDINKGDQFIVSKKENEQKFTTPPSRYSEAKIVKLMEELGIGRPSTYATTIETLRNRKYITDEKGLILITEQGAKTAHVLDKYFPNIVNAQYTADMEKKLDYVQDGSASRVKMLSDFYGPFHKEVKEAYTKMYPDEKTPTGEKCPLCGSDLIYRQGKNGRFVGCSNYPACNYVKKEEKKEVEYTGENCPNCGKPLVKRYDKKGNPFIGCSGYPECKYLAVIPEANKICPRCGAPLIKKKGKYGYFYGCSNYPKCDYMEKITKKKQ